MSQDALRIITTHAEDGARLRELFFAEHKEHIATTGLLLAKCLAAGGKILWCGNGGSAADAQHFSAELVNRFLMERPALPSLALNTDTSALTAIGNDYGYAQVFSKQVEALGNAGDVLVALSTSGQSPNILEALRSAQNQGLVTVGFSGGSGGAMLPLCTQIFLVPSTCTPLIQEVHGALGHILCALIDHYLFEVSSALQS